MLFRSNEQISQQRAVFLKDYLVRRGVAADRISVKGMGVDTTAATNADARHAEIKLIVTEKP